MTSLWLSFGAMVLAGILVVCWPLYRHEKRISPRAMLVAIGVIAASGMLYLELGTPGAPSGAGAQPSVNAMVAGLAARLEQNPEDIAGWKMLGRSYLQLEQYDQAVAALEQALERENGSDAQTLADLGEAVLLQQNQRIDGRAAGLFEAALAAAPNNPKALFYGGIAAIERNDRALAADRWETLLAQSPPENVQQILRERIREWRGAGASAATAQAGNPAMTTGTALSLAIAVSPQAQQALPGDATVFIIARDPQQPSPPIAVTRRKMSELPANVALSDADAMIPGRTLGQFARLEIVVRASASGNPMPAAGDWSGSATVELPASGTISVNIAEPQR
ncbi:MAG: tetratricopeptide repeat protein [Woeseia sp.]